jgi:hypothetical protein
VQACWTVASVSVTGTSHAEAGLTCQDFQGSVILPCGTLVAVVADGADSALQGGLGAQLAVHQVLERAREATVSLRTIESAQAELTKWVFAARTGLEAEAELRGIGLPDLATTLLVSLVSTGFVCVAQVGDGAIVSRDSVGDIQLLTEPVFGEYANETTFLTSTGFKIALQVTSWKGKVEQIMLFTDGLQRLALQWPGPVAYRPFCAPLFIFITQPDLNHEEQIRTFLSSARIRQRGDDDLTLVLASRPILGVLEI